MCMVCTLCQAALPSSSSMFRSLCLQIEFFFCLPQYSLSRLLHDTVQYFGLFLVVRLAPDHHAHLSLYSPCLARGTRMRSWLPTVTEMRGQAHRGHRHHHSAGHDQSRRGLWRVVHHRWGLPCPPVVEATRMTPDFVGTPSHAPGAAGRSTRPLRVLVPTSPAALRISVGRLASSAYGTSEIVRSQSEPGGTAYSIDCPPLRIFCRSLRRADGSDTVLLEYSKPSRLLSESLAFELLYDVPESALSSSANDGWPV